jgi:hypothetical protein
MKTGPQEYGRQLKKILREATEKVTGSKDGA